MEDRRRTADHIIEIKETYRQVESVLVAHKSVNQIFDERFKDLENWPTKSTTTFKVHVGLRESNLDAYTPKFVSIDPYHRNNPQLRSMEKYKLLYLQRFLGRKQEIDMEYCIRELKELKNEALKCYEDIGDFEIDISNGGQFLRMILLDGCFVVEFIRERFGYSMVPNGEVIIKSCIANQVCRDLLLIENQLPFFVLTKLDDMTKEANQMPFVQLVKLSFLQILPKMTPASFDLEVEDNNGSREINHLLQVLHMSCYPSNASLDGNARMDNIGEGDCKNSLCGIPLQIFMSNNMPKDKDELTWVEMMPYAAELSEAGVSFAKVGKIYKAFEIEDNHWDTTSLFDIKFKNGLLEIPCFKVNDPTESLLRNLIAYEQQSIGVYPKYFSDFALLMDQLIDTDKDVNLLRPKGIIMNGIGEDKEVASVFNTIGKGVILYNNFYYKEECRKVVQHCEKPWNRMKANLRRNYFHSPWAGVSTVAAIMLLLFTLTQTILSFISVLNK